MGRAFLPLLLLLLELLLVWFGFGAALLPLLLAAARCSHLARYLPTADLLVESGVCVCVLVGEDMLSSTRYWSVVALVRRAATATEVRRRCATSASSSLVWRHRRGVASPSSRSSTISRRSVAAPVAMRQLFASRECDTATQRSESSVSLALDRNDAGSVQSLRLHFHDLTQPAVEVNLMWLRDNCTCAKCLHAITKQRSVDTLSVRSAWLSQAACVCQPTCELAWLLAWHGIIRLHRRSRSRARRCRTTVIASWCAGTTRPARRTRTRTTRASIRSRGCAP